MRRRTVGLLLAAFSIAAASPACATEYTVDKDHSTVSFKVRHLFSQVQGTFDQFEGAFTYVPDKPEGWKAAATVQTASINTHVEKRDQHLRSPDFFDVEKYPTMTFTSTGATDVAGTSAKLHGDLTLHGVTKPVVFDLQIHGEGKDPWGNQRSGFTATTTINRKDFGLTWNQALESGQLLVGEEVVITLEIEGLAKG